MNSLAKSFNESDIIMTTPLLVSAELRYDAFGVSPKIVGGNKFLIN